MNIPKKKLSISDSHTTQPRTTDCQLRPWTMSAQGRHVDKHDTEYRRCDTTRMKLHRQTAESLWVDVSCQRHQPLVHALHVDRLTEAVERLSQLRP